MTNDEIADRLEQVADLLERKGENAFRVRSYRRAADTVREANRALADVVKQDGVAGVKALPGIGEKLADSIREMVESGRFGLLDRLKSEASPEDVLAEVPGVGEKLAKRIHKELGIDSLEDLERAAHDGRLAAVEGVGEEKVEGIRDSLAGRLSRSARRRAKQRGERKGKGTSSKDRPSVDTLLDVDAEYRRKAEAGKLRKIAPKRFNPESEQWLPILHTERGDWKFTALFSNTAKAHELGKTDDWVVLYYKRDGEESQNTVITAGSGPLKGKRIVRGREKDCRDHYDG